MALITKSRGGVPIPVYRVIANAIRPNARVPITADQMRAVATALTADTTGQFELVGLTGEIIMYDYAPQHGVNPDGTIAMKRAIVWEGVAFEVLSLMKVRVIT